MDAYSMSYQVRWTDIDANRHVRYSAYIDAAAELRYRFFTEHDLPPEAFDKLGVGPIYLPYRKLLSRGAFGRDPHHHLPAQRAFTQRRALESAA